ncbi:MAG TPA: hypothetical protein VFQ85_09285 [Mycobacteriales bacterium]|jgi:hypothetical protein|nr:hypothetical protein [Mycobacteriales bacterium]
MSRTRLLAGAFAAVAATAPAAHATTAGVPAQRVCVPPSVATLPCVTAGAGADVLLGDPVAAGSGHVLTPACTWTAYPTANETVVAATVSAPGADAVAATCEFVVGGVVYDVSAGGPGSGAAARGSRTVPGTDVVRACLVNASARWADGHREDVDGCTPA